MSQCTDSLKRIQGLGGKWGIMLRKGPFGLPSPSMRKQHKAVGQHFSLQMWVLSLAAMSGCRYAAE
jgi:hypothetical protein